MNLIWVLMGISLYLTFYTFSYARFLWKDGNKLAGLIVMVMAGCYPSLSIWLSIR